MNSGQLYAALFVLGSAPCPGYGPLDLIQMLIRVSISVILLLFALRNASILHYINNLLINVLQVRHQQEESIVHQAAKEDEE